MNYDYMLIIGLNEATKPIYVRALIDEGYEIISDKDKNVIARKKDYDGNIEKERDIAKTIMNIAKKYERNTTYFVDLCPLMDRALNSEDNKGLLTWWIRQAITRAIATK